MMSMKVKGEDEEWRKGREKDTQYKENEQESRETSIWKNKKNKSKKSARSIRKSRKEKK